MSGDSKKLVIVGAGFCGTLIAKYFDGTSLEVTLIDRKDYFLYQPGLHRGIFEPEVLRYLKVDLRELFGEVRVISEEVSQISSEKVKAGKKAIQFDILVIANGADYPIPLEDRSSIYTPTTLNEISDIHEALPSVGAVLVVGGGPIGVEVAGELGVRGTHKVTLVQSRDRLLPREPVRASAYASRFLEEHGARVITDERVVEKRGIRFQTDKGREIQAGICLWCTGISREKNHRKMAFPDSKLQKSGALNTDRYLRLAGSDNIFAGGDVTAVPEEKTAQNAERHAETIIENINRLRRNKELIPYRNKGDFKVISLGPKKGLATFKRWTPARGRIPSLLKKLIRKWMLWKYGT
ncbi:MAG: NAD(P)/FAD-dependent oxidoreductase [Candidatus Acetothermia bacterium]